MIIAYDKSVRKREQYNPADYEPLDVQQTPGTVQLMDTQVQPQVPGVVPAQTPAPTLAPAQSPTPAVQSVQPVPQAAPVPAVQSTLAPPRAPAQPGAVESRVVAPGATPPTDPAERLRWAYERAGIPMPATAPAAPPKTPEEARSRAYDAAGIAQPPAGWRPETPPSDLVTNSDSARAWQNKVAVERKTATNTRYLAAGQPVPYPEVVKVPAAPGSLPASVIAPETDAELAKEAKSDPVISGLEARLAAYQRRVDAAGGKVSPQVQQRIADLQKKAADRLKIVKGTVDAKRAEKAAKSQKDAETTQRSIESFKMQQETHAAGENDRAIAAADKKHDENLAAVLAGAQAAAKEGRFDDAKKAIDKGRKLVRTTAQTTAFNTVHKEIRDAETVKAAATFDAEKVVPAKRAITWVEKNYDRAISEHKSVTITYYRLQGDPKTDPVVLDGAWSRVQEAQRKVDAATDARSKAKQTLEDLEKQRESIKSGEISAAPQQPTGKPYAKMTEVEKDAHVLKLRKAGKI